MEFILICLLAVVLGLRGFRADRRTYGFSAVAGIAAALYVYHFQY
jgi:hypothetical protein